MTSSKRTIAIVVGADFLHGYAEGGVLTVGQFIYQTLLRSERYAPHVISMATSFRDNASVRLLAPSSWYRGVQLVDGVWKGIPFTHAGTLLSEFEFQRYRPRRPLTKLLNQFDLIQVVAGFPAIANAASQAHRPVCAFVATLAHLERASLHQQASFPRTLYYALMKPFVSYLDQQALRQVDHVFAETLYTKTAISPYIADDQITIDTIGVDTDRFTPSAHRSDDYILCTGRLADPRKNVRLLFNAYARVRQHCPQTPKLILAGRSGPSDPDWQVAGDLGIIDYVEFRADVSLQELVGLYQNAAFFVLSSDEEGLGIVLLEAMACATPVVSTRCGGPDSVVSDAVGRLTPIRDVEAMAESIEWMIEHPDQRHAMGLAGRDMVERRFSNQVVGQKYLDVYDRLLKTP